MNAIKGLPNIQEVSTLTEASLLSGTPKKDKASGANGGVLAKMGEFGILLIKDFSGMLTLNKEDGGSIMAALREVYDGSWTCEVGADGGRELHWQGKCGLLAAAIPNIDQTLCRHGEFRRKVLFLSHRSRETKQKRAMRALANTGHEIEIRQELNTVSPTII